MTQISALTPGELVAAMADITGVPVASVTLIDRALSEKGLRSKGGRGRSAARMGPRDATHLLLGLLVGGVDGNVPKMVERIGSSKPAFPQSPPPMFSSSRIWCVDELQAALVDVKEDHTFADVVEALIAEAAKEQVGGSLPLSSRLMAIRQKAVQFLRESPDYEEYKDVIDAETKRYYWGGKISVEGDWSASVMLKAGPMMSQTYGRFGEPRAPSFIVQSRSIDLHAIDLIGAALSGSEYFVERDWRRRHG